MAALDADLQAKLEAYLLGRLSGGEQTRIEALLFEDDDVFEAIRDAEDDLIDRYLAGELAPADRDAFETTFATSASRQDRITVARALSNGLASGGPARAPAPPAVESVQARRPRTPNARRLAPAGAALAAAVVIAIAWRAGLTGSPSPSTPEPGDSSPGSGETAPTPPGDPVVATFSLGRIDLRRSAGNLPRLTVPRGTTELRLRPELEVPTPGGHYAVTLRRVEGPVVWQGTARADSEPDRASVSVPARLVGPGDYVLNLTAPATPPGDSAEYPFRVVAED